ncbi:MAG: hypothetical protein IJU13_08555, partial [Bacteroidales bacterium]|nr:hypothetical protein [Bacteroidales bacterium]
RSIQRLYWNPMENDKQLKVGLIIALVFALFFACMLGYFIAVKNLWMCIAMGGMVISCCARIIQLYMRIK